jgi:hypothetical protein
MNLKNIYTPLSDKDLALIVDRKTKDAAMIGKINSLEGLSPKKLSALLNYLIAESVLSRPH